MQVLGSQYNRWLPSFLLGSLYLGVVAELYFSTICSVINHPNSLVAILVRFSLPAFALFISLLIAAPPPCCALE
ncbi:hypothetical protein SCA6_012457, partial [Theobroma cacao]